MKTANLIYWAARIFAAVIMFQTLYFKFTAAEESVFIFTTIGMEPWGRIGVGIMELIASVLVMVNATAWIGAGLSLGLMGGALLMHLTILGVAVNNDNGYLFFLALIVFVCSLIILYFNKEKIMLTVKGLTKG